MQPTVKRREFLQLTVVGTMFGLGGLSPTGWGAEPQGSKLISPGCRKSKVKVARLFMARPGGGWPKPDLDLEAEVRSYKEAFAAMKDELADVDFVVDAMVTSPDQVTALQEKLQDADGILVIHLNIGISAILQEILKAGRPTVVFAIPYSGHEWAGFGALMKQPAGAKLDCLLTTDRKQLAVAIRPFRALHHLREAKILNVTTRLPVQYAEEVQKKFGTQIQQLSLERVEQAYQAVSEADARAETERWLKQATAVVEPSPEEVFRSCKLALAFERLLDEEQATVMTVDCYGTMWDKTIKLPAYPCLGFSRLNNMGLGGICESDLRSAMTHILFQGLAGKPGFISDPTMDESDGTIILAHCMGTRNMQGPGQPAAPYKLRTVMERQQGVVPQVKMPIGVKATQALLVGTELVIYFTGQVVDSPDVDRGCRTKMTVKIDGDAEKLWKQWSYGLHRVTCYGDLAKDLQRFCRFADLKLLNEAA
jgi:L-arabinose isomerase